MDRDRRRTVGIVAALAVVPVAVVGFLFARALWWSFRPTPDFPDLTERPVAGVEGEVAFLRPYPDDRCIWTVPAAGGAPSKAACLGDQAGDLEWLPDGRIQSTRYQGGEGTGPTRRWIVDPRTRRVTTVPPAEVPPRQEPPDVVVGPDGEVVSSTSRRGRLTVRLTHGGRSRTLLSVDAPDTYTFGAPVWSPDGRWFVVKDDLDRILLVTTSRPSATRVLVDGGWGAAVTAPDPRRAG